MTKTKYLIKLCNPVRSKELYDKIGPLGVNVTDLGGEVLIYGNTGAAIFATVLKESKNHGEVFVYFEGG